MIPPETIKKILEAGVQAPSGSNSQPWKFKIFGERIEIIGLPGKDHKILNFKNRGTLVAHGALLENISIAASALGYEAKINTFPFKTHPEVWADVSLQRSNFPNGRLYPFISLRTTNRKPYRAAPLTGHQRSKLFEAAGRNTELKLIENHEEIKILAEASSVNEIITLENYDLHKLFFNEIVWTEEEEKKRGGGLYVKTMELKPGQVFALKSFFKHWTAVNAANKMIGFAKSVAGNNAKNYARASAWGAVLVEDRDEDFLNAGRVIERVWLEATALGLNMHLITGILFLRQRINAGLTAGFSKRHIEAIEKAYQSIADTVKVGDNKIIGLLFRVGVGDEPSARSYKPAPVIL